MTQPPTSDTLPVLRYLRQKRALAVGKRSRGPVLPVFRERSGLSVALAGFALIGSIGLVSYGTGPELSLSIFYLIPIALGAWWGGFSWGILFAVTSAVVWYLTDSTAVVRPHLVVCLWNGVVRFGFFVITSSLISRLREALLREQALARSDPLTGIANGRTFYEEAALEIERSGRTGRPLTLVYLDLDNFKEVNDRLGHSAGDELLRQVAQAVQKNTRAIDLPARLGGDEFAVLLPETDAAGTEALVGRLREALLREMARGGWAVTCSIGAATFLQPPAGVDAMVRMADGLMYQVKRGGKNCTHYAVLPDRDGKWPAPAPGRGERRAEARILCNRLARVISDDLEGEEEQFATIQDISTRGIRIRLGRQLREGTLLTLEHPGGSRVKTLLARVIWSASDPAGWLHGCQLASTLSSDKLDDWIG